MKIYQYTRQREKSFRVLPQAFGSTVMPFIYEQLLYKLLFLSIDTTWRKCILIRQ